MVANVSPLSVLVPVEDGDGSIGQSSEDSAAVVPESDFVSWECWHIWFYFEALGVPETIRLLLGAESVADLEFFCGVDMYESEPAAVFR